MLIDILGPGYSTSFNSSNRFNTANIAQTTAPKKSLIPPIYAASASSVSHDYRKLLKSAKKILYNTFDMLIQIIEKIKIFISKLFSFFLKKINRYPKINKIKEIFTLDFNYKEIENRILKFSIVHEDNIVFPFNYYNLNSYKSLKPIYQNTSYNQSYPLSTFEAGIKTYQAIVNLYVQRFLKRHTDMNHPDCLPSLQLIALRIAIKDSIDIDKINEYDHDGLANLNTFLPVEIKAKKACKMEACFLREIEWNISIRELISEDESNFNSPSSNTPSSASSSSESFYTHSPSNL